MSFSVSTGTPPLDEDDQLNAALQQLVVGITGLAGRLVRPRWQKVVPAEPLIDENWCAIGNNTIPDGGAPYLGQVSDTTVQLIQHEQFEVLASFYGPQSRTYARSLRFGLAIQQNRIALDQAGLGVRTIGQMIYLPEQIGTEWRGRADLHISFTRVQEQLFLQSSMLTVPVIAPVTN